MNQRSILLLQRPSISSSSSSLPKRSMKQQQRPLLPSFWYSIVVIVVVLLVFHVDTSIRSSSSVLPEESYHNRATYSSSSLMMVVTAFVVTTTTTTRSSCSNLHRINTFRVTMKNSKSNPSYTTNNKKKNKKQKEDEEESSLSSLSQLSRRQIIELSIGTIGLYTTYIGSREVTETDYGLWGILPVGTYKSKPTICETIVSHTIWTCDQKFGILNVQVPLRMTIIKIQLPSSSSTNINNDNIPKRMRIPNQLRYKNDDKYCLLIYNPIAPTQQCIQMIQNIEYQEQCHVRHIVIGSVALEHKVYAASMGQQFRYSTIWLTPGQYTFPFTIPEVPYLGFPTGGRTKIIPYINNNNTTNIKTDTTVVDWPGYWDTKEIQSDILGPIISRDGAFSETVLYHSPTRTLIVTDTCIQITKDIPIIYQTDIKPILYHARDTITDIVTATPKTLEKGWKRIVLFALYFMPSAIVIKDLSTAINERRPDINSDFLGIYPWDWVGNENDSWDALTGTSTNSNKPLVAPILQVLLLNRSPVEVLDFANRVANNWDIQRIIPSHFKNNLSLTGNDYRNAFLFLTTDGVPKGYPKPLDTDLQLLRNAEITLIESGAIVKAPPKIGTPNTSRADIIAQTTYRCRSNICAPKAES